MAQSVACSVTPRRMTCARSVLGVSSLSAHDALSHEPEPAMATKPAKEPQQPRVGKARDSVLVDLALQGGGSHGAFTWGVLDRLLDEPWLRIDGISGTSAGAMNAVVLAGGYAADGPAGAKSALEGFWRRVSQAGRMSPLQRGPLDVLLG